MVSRRFFSRVGQFIVLFVLLMMMLTAVLSASQPQSRLIAVDPTPTSTPTQAPGGWGDPGGG